MSAPTPVVRAVTYERDEHRCVSCGAMSPLSYQHRQAVGMGGSKRSPRLQDGVTACVVCNGLFEASMQSKALRFGWKVRRWVSLHRIEDLPVFYQWAGIWAVLTPTGELRRISRADAEARMLSIYGDEWLGWDS